MKTSQGAHRHGLTASIAVLACLAIAACGSSSNPSTSASSGSGAANTTTTSTTTTPGTGATANFAAQRAKLEACLKSHGVTLPTRRAGSGYGGFGAGGVGGGGYGGGAPGAGGGYGGGTPGTSTTAHRFFRYGGAGNSKFAAAFKACGADFGGRLAGGGVTGTGRFTPHFSTATLDSYIACVKKNGFTLPKPNTSGTGPTFPRSIETNKKFQAASKSCDSILQSAFRAGGGAGPGGGPVGTNPPTTASS